MWHFNTGDCLIEVTAWAGVTVHVNIVIKGYADYSNNTTATRLERTSSCTRMTQNGYLAIKVITR